MRPPTRCAACLQMLARASTRSDPVRPAQRAIWNATRLASTSSAASTSGSGEQGSGLEQQRQAARQRAWYLDDTEASTSSAPAASPGPPSHPGPQGTAVRSPRFTTFDPSRTTASSSSSSSFGMSIRPLPPNAPDHLGALHAFLTRSDTAGEVIDPGSVVFLHTPSARSARASEDLGVEGAGVEGRWDWVVVGVVRGRGKGVVGRAERAVRLWLKDNPIPELSTTDAPRRMPRVEADTDWTLVPVGSSRLCVNLFTQDGRDKWDLEDLYAAGD